MIGIVAKISTRYSRIMRIIRNFYNAVLEKTLNLVRAKPKFFKIAKLSTRN